VWFDPTTACLAPSTTVAAPDDEAAIRALEDGFAAAVGAGDVEAIMKSYLPNQSLVVFDVVPRGNISEPMLIVLEHVSVPVDLATGKWDLSSKP
jgi:hypothetical protein